MIKNFFFSACLLAVANSISIVEPLEASETSSETFTEGTDCNSADGKGAPACWKTGRGCVWAPGPKMAGMPPDGTCDYVPAKVGASDAQRIDKEKYKGLTEEQWNVTPYFEKKAAEKGIFYR